MTRARRRWKGEIVADDLEALHVKHSLLFEGLDIEGVIERLRQRAGAHDDMNAPGTPRGDLIIVFGPAVGLKLLRRGYSSPEEVFALTDEQLRQDYMIGDKTIEHVRRVQRIHES